MFLFMSDGGRIQCPAICNKVAGPWGHYVKWNKPGKKVLHGTNNMLNLKVKKNSQTHRNRVEKLLPGAKGGGNRKWLVKRYNHYTPTPSKNKKQKNMLSIKSICI